MDKNRKKAMDFINLINKGSEIKEPFTFISENDENYFCEQCIDRILNDFVRYRDLESREKTLERHGVVINEKCEFKKVKAEKTITYYTDELSRHTCNVCGNVLNLDMNFSKEINYLLRQPHGEIQTMLLKNPLIFKVILESKMTNNVAKKRLGEAINLISRKSYVRNWVKNYNPLPKIRHKRLYFVDKINEHTKYTYIGYLDCPTEKGHNKELLISELIYYNSKRKNKVTYSINDKIYDNLTELIKDIRNEYEHGY